MGLGVRVAAGKGDRGTGARTRPAHSPAHSAGPEAVEGAPECVRGAEGPGGGIRTPTLCRKDPAPLPPPQPGAPPRHRPRVGAACTPALPGKRCALNRPGKKWVRKSHPLFRLRHPFPHHLLSGNPLLCRSLPPPGSCPRSPGRPPAPGREHRASSYFWPGPSSRSRQWRGSRPRSCRSCWGGGAGK